MSKGSTTIAAPAKLTATFLDGPGKTLLEYSITGPTVVEVDSNAMVPRGGSGFILPNTRSVQLVLDLSSEAVTFNSAEAENLSFSVSLQPVLGANLVVNANAETLIESTAILHGWNSGDDFLANKWSSISFVAKDPSPEDRGVYLFNQKGSAAMSPLTAYQIYAGGIPCLWSGLLLAEARVPSGLTTGDPVPVPVVITAGAASRAP